MVTDELKRKIEGLIAQAVDDGKLVSSVHNVLDLLKENHLMWTQTLNPDRVGVHWENRDGVGLSCQQVHLLLDDVAAVGFSHEATSGICFEIPVDEGLRQIAMKFNETLHGSNMLPPMPEGMKYLSVAGFEYGHEVLDPQHLPSRPKKQAGEQWKAFFGPTGSGGLSIC